MYDDILVPTDGSDTVSETLSHALPIATNNDATIHGLYVVDTRVTTAATDDTKDDLEDSLESEGTAAIEEIERAAREHDVDVLTSLERGTPSKTILEYADERDIDLIVIGTHGKSPREKIVSLGSVSERVVDNASIPVLVVRDI